MEHDSKRVPFPSGKLTDVYVINGYETTSYKGITHYGFYNIPEFGKALLSAILLKTGRLNKEELHYIRSKLDYTQKDIANIIGTTEQTYMQWERGDRYISKAEDTLLRIFVSQKLKKQLTKEGQNLKVEFVSNLTEKIRFVEYIGKYNNNSWIIETKEIISRSIQELIRKAMSTYTVQCLKDNLSVDMNNWTLPSEENHIVPIYFSHSNDLGEYQKEAPHVIH